MSAGKARRARSPKATAEFAASLTVVPYGPELNEALGTRLEWLARMAPRYGAVVAMVSVLQKNERELEALARDDGDGTALELCEWLNGTAKWFQAQADLMRQASVRVMVGMARAATLPPGGDA